ETDIRQKDEKQSKNGQNQARNGKAWKSQSQIKAKAKKVKVKVNPEAVARELRYYAAKDIRFGVDARALILVFAPTCKDDEISYMSLSLPVAISKDDTVILDGAGDKKGIEERCEQLRSSIELSTFDYDKEKLQERLAKLFGGVSVLKIGGASEAKVGEKKDRVTDALNATKAAVEEGIVPGVAPVHTIAANAGVEGAVVVGKLLEQDNPDFGYYVAKGFFFSPPLLSLSPIHLSKYVDMVKEGIIDPLKVIRTALVDAAR
ncbi:chaperonin CPN60-2, mitochondrial, partial [Tanacetum coccineum]